MELPPLSLYVHLPWCVRKCPYCDFNSHTAGDNRAFARYLDALLADLDVAAGMADSRELISVFFGGGTPSLFPPAAFERLLDRIRDRFTLPGDVEITMEANPGTVELADPAGYRQPGINRLSIGAQSFDQRSLEILGRIHGADDTRRAVEQAVSAGFSNINVDLMYALPGQDVELALADIEQAASLGPAHISWYQLTLEPNTVFYARPPDGLPDHDAAFEIQQRGQARLRELGYQQYEVSAYARDDLRCRHNLNYWNFGDYLAVGAGSHGKLTGGGSVYRFSRPANPLMYMQAMESDPSPPPLESVSDADLAFEFMLNALRLSDGFSEGLFTARTGLPGDALTSGMREGQARGLIEKSDDGRWSPTTTGRRFLDDLQAVFLPD